MDGWIGPRANKEKKDAGSTFFCFVCNKEPSFAYFG
jgi:hypothetical protein